MITDGSVEKQGMMGCVYRMTKSALSISRPQLLFFRIPPLPTTAHRPRRRPLQGKSCTLTQIHTHTHTHTHTQTHTRTYAHTLDKVTKARQVYLQFLLIALVLLSQVCGKTSQLLVQNSKQIIKKAVFFKHVITFN